MCVICVYICAGGVYTVCIRLLYVGAMSQFACKSDRFVKCILDKSCEMRPAVVSLTSTGLHALRNSNRSLA